MTRLEKLCQLHGQQGGTIHEFNRQYSVDFMAMSDNEYCVWEQDFYSNINLEYQPRFVNPEHSAELVNLYYLARTALSGKPCTPYDRMLWASQQFASEHSYVSATGAYKDLGGLLGR